VLSCTHPLSLIQSYTHAHVHTYLQARTCTHTHTLTKTHVHTFMQERKKAIQEDAVVAEMPRYLRDKLLHVRVCDFYLRDKVLHVCVCFFGVVGRFAL